MASMKQLIAALILFFLLAQVIAEASLDGMQERNEKASELGQSQLSGMNCGAACLVRCSKASRQKICFRTCTGCCRVCNCVPPGTYGNKQVCPCYATLKTTGGKLKCP